MPAQSSYQELLARVQEVMLLGSVKAILTWDMDTYMPPGAVGQRGDQFELLQGLMHQWETAPEIGRLLAEVQASSEVGDFNEVELRNIALIQRHYDRQTKLPHDLVKAIARAKPRSIHAWKKAKKKRNFAIFEQYLAEMVTFAREKAAALDPGKDPYDVLLDLYEPGMTTRQLHALFDPLKRGLVSLLSKYANTNPVIQPSVLDKFVPLPVQQDLARSVAEFVGMDFKRNRIDETEHPFSVGFYDDIRVAVHYYEEHPTAALFATLHEGGHAIYDANLPPEWWWTPVGFSCSLGIHESQSRFVENVVGRSPEFWSFFYPHFQDMTGSTFKDIPQDIFLQAINAVQPSKIRMEADEVTYSLHVILRFEIERALLHEEITVPELPQVWNEKVQQYLGLTIENDAEGVLQDGHWSGGSFGYFPTYVLGNIYGGMFLNALGRAVPSWQDAIAAGNFTPARDWLIEHIYRLGNLYDPRELVFHVTGSETSPNPFLSYLETKFTGNH